MWLPVARILHFQPCSAFATTLVLSHLSLHPSPLLPCPTGPQSDCHPSTAAHTPTVPRPVLPLAPPPLVLAPTDLKPGRVFIVANLQGAYYTLLELLSKHKFDFRSDNLLHVGNLVGDRCRNTAALLKLAQRHSALGPMGANECVALLSAARARVAAEEAARVRQQQQEAAAGGGGAGGTLSRGLLSTQLRQQGQAQEQQQQDAAAKDAEAVGAGRIRAAVAREEAKSGEQQAAGGAGESPAPPSPSLPCGRSQPQGIACGTAGARGHSGYRRVASGYGQAAAAAAGGVVSMSSGSDSDLSSSCNSDDSEDDDEEDEVVEAPATPAWEHQQHHHAQHLPGLPYDTAALSYMLSMPAAVVLEAYGVVLQHAGPEPLLHHAPSPPCTSTTTSQQPAAAYHTIFSHRRGPASPVPPTAQQQLLQQQWTGLASCRGVVRCAVLPPLSALQARSPGFAARVAQGCAPSRGELLLEVVEEPIAELDLPRPVQQHQQH